METTLVLDALLALIVLLFVPIGAWRGAVKEVAVAAGVLLGAAIAAAWAARWGDEVAGWLPTGVAATRFWIAVAIVLLCAVVLGYGGGAALGPTRSGWGGRLVGALLAGLNGALMVGLTLTFIERYLLAGEPIGALDDGPVAWVLVHRFDWLLVAAALILLPLVVGGVVLGRGRHPEPVFAPLITHPDAAGDRLRPVRVPNAADAGKYEPSGPNAHSWQVPANATEVRATPPTPKASTWPEPPRRDDDRANGNGARPSSRFAPGRSPATNGAAGVPVAEEWLRRASAMTRPAETDSPEQRTEAIASPAPPDGAVPSRPIRSGEVDRAQADRPAKTGDPVGDFAGAWSSVDDGPDAEHSTTTPAGIRCLTCGALVKGSDVFCADCGAAI